MINKKLTKVRSYTKISNICQFCATQLKIFSYLTTADSLYLDYPLSRISFYLKQNIWSFEISPRTLHSLSIFRTSISRTFPYIEQIFRSLEPFSLSIENLHIRISFSNSRINSNLNQNKNFDRK